MDTLSRESATMTEEPEPTPAAAPPERRTIGRLPPESPIRSFLGTYRWTGGIPEQRELWRKIQNIAATFNFIAKPIVRDKLAEGNVIAKEIRIEIDGDNLVVTRDKSIASAPLDASSTVKVRATNGEMMDMSYSVSNTMIEQAMKGLNKGRVNQYELKDGKLIVHTRVYASQLPKELVYDLTYERVDAGAE